MQRPPKHVVANDAAQFVQHVAVDSVQQPVEPIRLVVIDGVVGSIVSVIPIGGCTVEFIQLRPIVVNPR